MEIWDLVRKNHEMIMDVRANFESQLQQAEKKLEDLSLGIEERLRDAELLRAELEVETTRAKRDEMTLALACHKAVEKSDLLLVSRSVQSVSCTTSVPSSGNDVTTRTSMTRQS